METLNRLLVNVLSYDLEASKAFYTALFDFRVDYDSDWFVHLISAEHQLELGILSAEGDMVPTGLQPQPRGFFITLVVQNADSVFWLAKEKGLPILSEPEDTFYGQRRLVLKSPEGSIIDVSSPISGVSPDSL